MAAVRHVTRAEALGQQVVASLRSDILTGALPPDALLVEASLAQSFGVSRGPIRDALRTLNAEGLIDPAGRSFRVVGLDEQDVYDLYALRELLETSAMQQCTLADPETYQPAAEAALEDMRRADIAEDPTAFARADVAFHSAFYAACGNRRLLAVWEQHVPMFAELFSLTDALDETLTHTADGHRTLLETVYQGDPETIAADVRAHLTDARQRIIAAQRKNLARTTPEQAQSTSRSKQVKQRR